MYWGLDLCDLQRIQFNSYLAEVYILISLLEYARSSNIDSAFDPRWTELHIVLYTFTCMSYV